MPLTFSTKIIHFSLSTFICLQCVVLGSFGLTLKTTESERKSVEDKTKKNKHIHTEKAEKNETTKIAHIMKMATVRPKPNEHEREYGGKKRNRKIV